MKTNCMPSLLDLCVPKIKEIPEKKSVIKLQLNHGESLQLTELRIEQRDNELRNPIRNEMLH